MKSFFHALHVALILSLLSVNPAAHADPRPSIPTKSFKGGFSSQRASAPPRAPASGSASRGGFGSFSSAPARAPQKSDSALSQQLDRDASEANALRTLDARRAAQQEATRDTRPVPGYENRQYGQPSQPMPMPAPQQAPQSGNGMAGVVTGLVLGQIANGAHARNHNGYPAQVNQGTSTASLGQAPTRSFFGGVIRLFMWLVVLSAIGWLIYFLVQRNRRKAAENKPHYTFEGQ